MRLFLADPALCTNIGHHANAARYVIEAARARGIETRVLAHKSVEHSLQSELSAQPFFRIFSYTTSDGDQYSGWLNVFYDGVEATKEDLDGLSDIGANDLLFFHGAQPIQLMAAIEWAAQRPAMNSPRIVVELGTDPGVGLERHGDQATIVVPNPQVDARATLFRFIAHRMTRAHGRRVEVITYDATVSGIYTQLMNREVGVLPFPTPAIIPPRNRAGASPITVAVLGHQQLMKGFHLMPEVAKILLKKEKEVRLLIHNSDSRQLLSAGAGLMRDAQLALRRLADSNSRIILDERAVDFSDWTGLLEGTDLILCPYDPVRYATGHSGLASAALANGIPFVAPAQTSLSNWMDEFGAPGTTFAKFEARSIAKAVREVIAKFDVYADRARKAAERWANVHGPDNFIEAMLVVAPQKQALTGNSVAQNAKSDAGPAIVEKGANKAQARIKNRGPQVAQPANFTVSGDLADHLKRGIELAAKENTALALAKFERAIHGCATSAEAWFYRGMALEGLGQAAEAYDSYAQAMMLMPLYTEAEARLSALAPGLGRASSVLTPWMREPSPSFVDVMKQKIAGVFGHDEPVIYRHHDPDEIALRARLVTAPSSHENATALGRVLSSRDRIFEAEHFFRYALMLRPWSGEAAVRLCGELEKQPRKLAEIWPLARAAIEAGSTDERLAPVALWAELALGRWDDYQRLRDASLASFAKRVGIPPFSLLHISSDLAEHKVCAEAFYLALAGNAKAATMPSVGHDGSRLKIGYMSADFRNHAVAQLIAELFELHDQKRFSTVGFSTLGGDDTDMSRRVRGAFGKFVELNGLDVNVAVQRIVNEKIDILVDLTGYTFNAQPSILAARPAPILVNYLGYPGTLGTTAVDYVIVDDIVAPPTHQAWFAEALVHMPGSYQVNDRKRPRGNKSITRQEVGLPKDAMVFCCFNEVRKIDPSTFAVWMRILDRVPGSVLWLYAPHQPQVENLRAEARRAGIDPDRIIGAGRMAHAEHLSRYQLADLFLDTQPYGAHTTASDSLWVGCPVLTLLGSAFPGRVGASLLTAVGLTELIATSWQEYENLAVALGTDSARRVAVRQKLASLRAECKLFDTPRFTRQLEWAYREMWRRHINGEKPQAFRVPDIS